MQQKQPDEPVQPENPGVKTGDEAHTALWLAAASVSLLAADGQGHQQGGRDYLIAACAG